MKLTQYLLLAVALSCSVFSIVPVAAKPHSETYDYIVIGGGTAGCVAAARLSEDPRNSVLLIEAGHDNSEQPGEVTGTEPAIFPGYGFPDLQGANIIPMRTRESTPNGFTPNHYVPITRTLGGGSATNGQCYSRLGAEDWEYFNISGWSYDEVLPFQTKVETFHPHAASGTIADFPARGTNGPMSITTFPPGDLSAKIIQKMSDILGLPVKSDLDSGDANGVGQFGRNTKHTSITRESSWTAYLKPFASRPNLVIQTDSLVTSIEWQTQKVRGKTSLKRPLVADGVYYTVNALPENVAMYARATKEIILSAGAINSPKILMLSGVGPATHLAKRGIELVLASEQVGKNLQDHIALPTMTFMFAEPTVTDRVISVAFGRSGLLPDKFMDYELAFVQAANGIPISATARASVVAAIPVLTRSSANGAVTLLDSNPNSNPLIDFKAFADPIDAQILAWLGNTTRSIAMNTPGFIAENAPGFKLVPLDSPLAAWSAWSKSGNPYSGAKSYSHFVGTCRMAASIATGVVDSQLKVFGTSNLRVADMSVIPRTVSQRPFATALLAGERVADFILTGQ